MLTVNILKKSIKNLEFGKYYGIQWEPRDTRGFNKGLSMIV
jgi:hypothetical protein